MEPTENSGITQNIADTNIQGNDFANELYGKLESDISFEDALKNNSSNTDQEIQYLDVNADNFELNNLNGTAAYQNNGSTKENDKIELQESTEKSETVAEEKIPSALNEADNNPLDDKMLGETSMPLQDSIESKVEKHLLEESGDDIVLRLEPDEVTVRGEENQTDQPDTREEFECVVEEPTSKEESIKNDVEIQEIETIMIEEISTDDSVTNSNNPPVIVVPDEQEKVEKIETEENTESVIIEQAEESVDESPVVMEVKSVSDNNKQINESDVLPVNEKTAEVQSEFEKQIEEASIVIEEEVNEEATVILEQDAEEVTAAEDTAMLSENNSEEEGAKDDQSPKARDSEDKEKQKKSIALEKIKIPHHVLGTNIEKPVRDLCSNGRVPPKPRLGVKIPYRNLTSQIVSKQEIEQVILDRARAKRQQPPQGGDLFFTKKLTQRLARKIIPEEKKKAAELEEQKKKELEEKEKLKKEQQTTTGKPEQDNADLLAILEGDADDITDIPGNDDKSKDDFAEIKEWEKEVALKQLEQLPQRRRGRSAGSEQPLIKKLGTVKKITSVNLKSVKSSEDKPSAVPVSQKPPTEEKSKENTVNVAEEVDIEPRFSTNSVVKTYTRKRKAIDSISTLAKTVDVDTSTKKPFKAPNEQKEQKISIDLPPNAYVTKSSRVIKRKVIWDPDEAASPIRSYKASKPDTTPKQEKAISPPKTVEKKPAVKSAQKSIDEKVKTPQKVVEEKQKVPEKAPEKSPQKKSPLLKKPKRLTEVDKLLMDEGAVNMIYDVKTTEDQNQIKQKKRNLSTISLDKVQRELLNKTNEIKNDLQISSTRTSPKSLRKKEGTPSQAIKKEVQPGQISRKKSKDSNRSSVHSPPASPAYMFSQHAEASRIIRRHSSSSFSSGDEAPLSESESSPVKVVKKKGGTEQKSTKKLKVEKGIVDKNKSNEEATKSFNDLVDKKEVNTTQYGELKTLSIKTIDQMVHIIMNIGKKDAFLNIQALNELTAVLNQIKSDNSCNAVLLTSSHKSFCQGLDYKYLVADSEEQRKKKSTALANAVKEFLQTLADFPKFIAAAVHGNTVGLGVTMLPLFDMVLSSDKATYSVPYCRLGCIAEGGCLLNLPHVASCGLASELLYACQKVAAGDAAKRGLVTRIMWAEEFQTDVLNTILGISNQCQQGLEVVKKQLRQSWIESVKLSLAAEANTLMEQWISEECQKTFGKYRLDKE